MQTQVDLINASGDKDWQTIDKQWQEGVGGAQKCLPIHLIDEYCSIELVSVTPDIQQTPLQLENTAI